MKTIFKDHLVLRKVKSRLVPKTLNFLKKVVALMCVKQCFLTIRISIITADETSIYAYDPETTDQSSEYRAKGEDRPNRARQTRSKIKVMMTVFCNFRGVL